MREDVNENERLQRLIAEASARIGSQNKLAAALGYTSSNVTEWRTGKRPCPVAAQALMADLAGLDAEAVTLHAVIEGERNLQRREHLVRVLGKVFQQHGAATFSALFASVPLAYDYLTRCIQRLSRKRSFA